ncbi:MAG: hypothetical protein AB7Q81_15900 [Gammaproteobacteria bacterium]
MNTEHDSHGATGTNGRDKDKLNKVADYYADESSPNALATLLDMASKGLKKDIKTTLEMDAGLKDYLEKWKKSALNPGELEHCAKWGLGCAQDPRVSKGNATTKDTEVRRQLRERESYPTGEDDGGTTPVGG